MHIQGCPFCDKEIGTHAFMQSLNFVAVYNIAPILEGHSLVIPRDHISDILGLQADRLNEFILFATNVTRFLLNTFHGEGYDWSIQSGEAAGQTIPHLHLHIIIRHAQDMPENQDWYPKIRENESAFLDSASRKKLSPEEYSYYTELLRAKSEIYFKG